MYRGRTLSLSLPPFHGWVKRIVLTCAIVYFLEVVLRAVSPTAYDGVMQYLGLVPGSVLHWGMIWQLVTYVRSLANLEPQNATPVRAEEMQAKKAEE